jgi:ketosteroid isomerase-like protein
VNQRQREAHLERDARAMVETLAEGFLSVEDGAVSRPTRAQLMSRFQAYFAGVRIHEWEDLSEPHIQVSADGTLAWMAVHKRVRATEADGLTRTTVFAWLATFEKRQGRWLQTSVTSTREPQRFAPDTTGPGPREL